jgi:O-antigen/teichoic acid export membrane protein
MMAQSAASFRNVAVRGTMTTALAQALKIATQTLTVVILARLLSPSDFGLWAMVMPVVAFVSLFQDLGLQQAVIQSENIDEAQLNRLFWIGISAAGWATLGLLALSPVAAWFYDDSRVALVVAMWSVPMLLTGCSAMQLALLNRAMKFSVLAIIDVAVALSSIAVAVAAAALLRSYWALWWSAVSGALALCVLAWSCTSWRPGPPFAKADTKLLMGFGYHLTGFNFLIFLARNLDNVIIAKVAGITALGFYDRAYKLLVFPIQNINGPVSRVMIPLLSRLQNDPARFRAAYIRMAGAITVITVPGVAAAVAAADPFIRLLLGDRWAPVVPIFSWLGVAGILQVLNNTVGWIFISQGRSRELFHAGIYNAATTVLAFIVGIQWGPVGLAAAYAISDWIVRAPVVWWLVDRIGPIRISDMVALQAPLSISAVATFFLVRFCFSDLIVEPVVTLIVSVVVSYVLAAGLLATTSLGRNSLAEVFRIAFQLYERVFSRSFSRTV